MLAQIKARLPYATEQILRKDCARLLVDYEFALDLLERLSTWDHMQTAADGPFWLSEIKKVLK